MLPRSFHRLLAATCLCMLAWPTVLPAQTALQVIPADAPIVFQVRGFSKARERLGTMIGNALPDLAPTINTTLDAQLLSGPFKLLKDRDASMIPADQPIFIVLPDLEKLSEDTPAVAVLLPVTDYAKFTKQFLTADEQNSLKKGASGIDSIDFLDDKLFMTSRKSYVAMSPSDTIIRTLVSGDSSLDTTLGSQTRTSFLAADVSVYINLKTINDLYGPTIEQFRGLFDLMLQQQGGDQANAAMAKAFFDGFLQVLKDGRAGLLALDFRPVGLNLRLQASFAKDTSTSKFLGELKPARLEEIGKLPSGEMMYSAFRLDPQLFKALAGYLYNVMGNEGLDEAAAKAMRNALLDLRDLGTVTQYSTSSFPLSGLRVTQTSDPAKAVAAELAILKQVPKNGMYQSAPIVGEPKLIENDKTYREFKLNYVTLQFDFDKLAQAQPGMPPEFADSLKKSMEQMLGKRVNAWFGTNGKMAIQVTASDWNAAKKLIDRYLEGQDVGTSEGFQLTRKNLPAQATIFSLIETGRTTKFYYDFITGLLGSMGMPLGEMPKVNLPAGPPSYLGFAVQLKEGTGQVDFFLPTTAVQQIRAMFGRLLQGPID